MTRLFAGLLLFHGAIHLLGAAKGWRWAALPALTQPISPMAAVGWAVAAMLFLVSGIAVVVWPRWWWIVASAAVLISTVVIAGAWTDAKAGAAVNALVLVGIVFGVLAYGPTSLRAEYERDVTMALQHGTPGPPVTDSDLAALPQPLQRYLRRAGLVGRPRAGNARIRMTGRIRSGPGSTWMPFVAEQYTVSQPAARLFYMTATMRGLPMQGYHRYVGDTATMRIKAAAAVTVVDAAGPEMNQSETVTMLNDLCILATPMLLDAGVRWESIDAHDVRATFTNAGQTIGAVLSFDDAGDLVDFWSDDRYKSADGKTMTRMRWSTPVRAYRQFGPYRLSSAGEARWHEPAAAFAYIELNVVDAQFNVTRR
jgi:hypothetical protein